VSAHVRSLLSDYIDGELNDDAAQQVHEHLASCDACATSYRALRRTVRFVQANALVDVPPDSAERGVERFYRSLMSETEST
jgi:anti-sigma factor RsiW